MLCNKESAFAELEQAEQYTDTRTHGSLHEREIPLIAVNARKAANYYEYHIDIVRAILETVP